MGGTDKELVQKESIFTDVVKTLEKLAGRKLEYGEGIVTAYTLTDKHGDELIELQTDYGDHLDLIVVSGGHPYSLGGSYIHGIEKWNKFADQAKQCLRLIFDKKIGSEEEWFRAGRRLGGRLFIPTAHEEPHFVLHDRTGVKSGWFANVVVNDSVLLRDQPE